MKISVISEISENEKRVSVVPDSVSTLVKKGHEGFDLSRKKCKKINSLARQLSRIISIHYDYSKPYQERTEEEKERWRKNSDENSPYRQAQKEYFKAHANIQI